jgi:hypothetical protein
MREVLLKHQSQQEGTIYCLFVKSISSIKLQFNIVPELAPLTQVTQGVAHLLHDNTFGMEEKPGSSIAISSSLHRVSLADHAAGNLWSTHGPGN